MSLLTPEPGLVFWMTLSFGAVLFVLVKFGFPTILKSIDKRKNFIDESLQGARKLVQNWLMLKAGEELMAATREEQATMLRETTTLREKLMTQAREDARKESEKIIAAARDQVCQKKKLSDKLETKWPSCPSILPRKYLEKS